VALFGLACAGSLVVVAAAALLKFVLEAVLASDWTKAALIVLGVAAMYAASVVIGKVQLAIGFGMNERFAQHVDQALLRMAHGGASIEVLDSPNVLDQMQLLQQKRNYIIQSPYTAASLISLLVAVLFTAALLVHIHPLLIGVAILAVPSIYLGRVRQTWQHAADRQYAGRSRALGSLFELLTSAAAAMEVRIFGLADELVRRYADLARQSDGAVLASAMRGAAVNAAGTLVSAAGYAAAVLIALRLAAAGVIGLGDVVLVLLLSLQLQAQISGATAVIGLARETGLSLDLLDTLRRAAAAQEQGRAEVPAALERGNELDGVTYRYPERPEVALAGVSVSIPAGSVVALAGDNGAGKSTLASILAGLLEPTSGSVRIDDLPISEADIRSWRRRVGLAQQEFALFEFLAGHVIGVGDVERVDDQDAVWEAAHAAAADELIRS
jgi:ATP-binding cassette subfamily B protein